MPRSGQFSEIEPNKNSFAVVACAIRTSGFCDDLFFRKQVKFAILGNVDHSRDDDNDAVNC